MILLWVVSLFLVGRSWWTTTYIALVCACTFLTNSFEEFRQFNKDINND